MAIQAENLGARVMTATNGMYGNLADAALAESRVCERVRERAKVCALSPATRLVCGAALAVTALISLSILLDAPQHIAEATPLISDIEDWLVWGDAPRF